MGVLKRFETKTFTMGDVTFSAKVKILNYREAPAFVTAMAKYAELAERFKPKEDGEKRAFSASEIAELYGCIEADFAAKAFKNYLRDIQDLQDEDGNSIATGEALFEVASMLLVMDVLGAIQSLSLASGGQGKDSGSQPRSSSAETTASEPAAPSTESAASPAP